MARVARAGRFFGFGLAIYLLSYLYIYDIGVWTLPPARIKGRAQNSLQVGVRLPLYELRLLSSCVRARRDHNPPYPPLVSALRLVCCLRIQIWLSLSSCCACSHRVFTLGAPCMGLLGPCRLKSFLRQSIYYHIALSFITFLFGYGTVPSGSKFKILYRTVS